MNLSCEGFLEELASKAAAPGGGGASALVGAAGVALGSMVGSLTVGKKKYAEFDGLARETLEKARDLEHRFLDVMQRDTEAFNAVSAVFAMPKGTDEEKAALREAVQPVYDKYASAIGQDLIDAVAAAEPKN